MTYSFLTPSRDDVRSLQDSEQRSIAASEGSFLIPLTAENEPKLVGLASHIGQIMTDN